jgi:hypothetical protein
MRLMRSAVNRTAIQKHGQIDRATGEAIAPVYGCRFSSAAIDGSAPIEPTRFST